MKNQNIENKSTKIFHIAGITDLYRQQLLNKLKLLKMFMIFDLDEETEKIYKEKDIQTKLKDINNVKPATKKKLENEVNEYWKKKLDDFIKKCIKDNENAYGIIFIGNTLNIKQMKYKVVIPISDGGHKFFLKVNFKQNAQEIIKYNLKKYHDDIVEGDFPLDLINLEYLMNTRELLQKGFQKLNYNVVPLDKITYFFNTGIHEKKPEFLYVVLPQEYDKVINANKKIYGFNEDWLALTSITTGLDRGYQDGVAYIKEKIKGSYKKLESECYIYVVSSNNFLPLENSKSKFTTDRPIKIIKSLKVENILNKLKELKIKLL